MTNFDVREIYKDGDMIGLIWKDSNDNVEIRAKDNNSEKIIKSFVSHVKVDVANIESDISVSNTRVVLISDKDWLSFMEYGLPPEYYASPIDQMTKKQINDVKL